MSTERDELSQIVFTVNNKTTIREADRAAEAILAAGYRRPRMIATVGELDVLSKNAVIMQPGGTVLVHDGQMEDPWASYAEDPFGGPIWTSSAHVTLPVTVLHEGNAA